MSYLRIFTCIIAALIAMLLSTGCSAEPDSKEVKDDKNVAKVVVTNYMNEVWVNKSTTNLDLYIAPDIKQHNVNLDNNLESLQTFLPLLFTEIAPDMQWEVVRVIAEEDMVVIHSFVTLVPDTPGSAVVDIFRVQDDKIVEHWDVTAELPAETVSGNHPVFD